MAFGRYEGILCVAAPLIGLLTLGCSDGDSLPTGAGGSGGAGSVVEAGVDTLDANDVAAPDVADVDDSKPTIAVLADDIFWGPFFGTQVEAGADVGVPPTDGSDPLPIRYTFDTSIEGSELVPGEPGQARPREALVHNVEDAQGSPSSGSLEVQRSFEPFNRDSGVSHTVVRLLSVQAGDHRDWRGYRGTGSFKVVTGSAPCASVVAFYVRAGADRALYLAGTLWITSREWRSLTLDLPVTTTAADLSQVVELGIFVDHDCVPN